MNHIDSNRNNNKLNNLEWVDQSLNNIHAYKYGFREGGEKSNFAKLSNEQVHQICKCLEEGLDYCDTLKVINLSKDILKYGNFRAIKSKKNWKQISSQYNF